MEQSAHSIFFVFDILQLIFDRSPFQAGTVVQASFGNHCLIHLFVGKAVGQVGCDLFHLCLCLGFQPFEPILGCSIFFPVSPFWAAGEAAGTVSVPYVSFPILNPVSFSETSTLSSVESIGPRSKTSSSVFSVPFFHTGHG